MLYKYIIFMMCSSIALTFCVCGEVDGTASAVAEDVNKAFLDTVPPVSADDPAFDDMLFASKIDSLIPMVFVSGGTFDMGCTEEQGNDCNSSRIEYPERPVRHVTVGSYYIGKYGMTQDVWKYVMGEEYNRGSVKGDRYPADSATWDEIQIFIGKLNDITGRSYRLPTEAEWEFAARGGTLSRGFKYSGSNTADDVAWHSGNNNGKAQPVGTKAPNELGLYDMSGNVWEWVKDYYANYNVYTETDNPQGPAVGDGQGPAVGAHHGPAGASGRRVLRSGSWPYDGFYTRVSYRRCQPQNYRGTISFRLALPAPSTGIKEPDRDRIKTF